VFYIKEGKVKLSVHSKQGKEATLALLEARDFLGEGCLASDEPLRMATATAITDCVIVKIAPIFVAIEGGSVGYRIGGSSTDIVMLFMNDRALQSLLGDKFKLGADASVAAGPVGRNAAAATDVKMSAEILSYSRAKGVFAGVSLNGAVVQADKSGDEAMYGKDVSRRDIFHGKVAVPKSAEPLLHEIKGYVSEAKAK